MRKIHEPHTPVTYITFVEALKEWSWYNREAKRRREAGEDNGSWMLGIWGVAAWHHWYWVNEVEHEAAMMSQCPDCGLWYNSEGTGICEPYEKREWLFY